ncbi:MAG: hypothetical protein AB1465_02620 [Patescibacteria group bacterium]
MTKRQKLIIIIGIIAIVIAGGFYIYLLLQQRRAPEIEDVALTSDERKNLTLTDEEKKKGITLDQKEKELAQSKKSDVLRELLGQKQTKPEKKVVSIIKIIDKEVKFPTLSVDQKKILYFDPQAREFYQAELNGTALTGITRGNFTNLENVSWSQDRSKAVLTISNEETKNREYFYFDFATQESKKIDSHFENPTISFDGKKIVYIYTETDKNIFNLSVADPDGSNWRKIAFLNNNQGKIDWLLGDRTIFIPQADSTKESGLYVYDVAEGKNSFVFISGKYSFDAKFSYDGKQVLWQEGDKGERRPSLYISPLAPGKSAKKLLVNGLAEKCAWFSDNLAVLCAIPENFSNYYRQPESWLNDEFVSRDSFYKIDSQTNELTKVVEAKQFNKDYDVASPFMAPDGKTMYFVRKNDGKLYALQMP